MAEETESIPLDLFGAGTIVAIRKAGEEKATETPIIGVSTVQRPNQNWNTKELQYLDQTTGMKRRIKTSRNGGDLTMAINMRDNDEGADELTLAFLDKEEEYVISVTYPSGTCFEYKGVVSELSPSSTEPDALNSHNCIMNVNYAEVQIPVTEEEEEPEGDGGGTGS